MDFSKIDAERVIIDPEKLWIFVRKPIVFGQCRPFLIASKLQDDGVIDNRPKTCTGPNIFLDNITPRIGGALVVTGPSSQPCPAGSIANMTRKYIAGRNSHMITPSAINSTPRKTIQPRFISFSNSLTGASSKPRSTHGPPLLE
jgi:hypothetical protein